jgi:hypothetical protein
MSHGFMAVAQFMTTVKGTLALGPVGVTNRNRFPSGDTSPTIVPGGAWKRGVGPWNAGPVVTSTAITDPSGPT